MRNLIFQFLSFLWLLGPLNRGLLVPASSISAYAHPTITTQAPPGPFQLRIQKRSILNDYREYYTGSSLILPVRAAAQMLTDALDTVVGLAADQWASDKPAHPSLTLGNHDASITFVSSNRDIPVPWEFIIFFCEELADGVNRGWTGIYSGSFRHRLSLTVIYVQMSISMVAAAA